MKKPSPTHGDRPKSKSDSLFWVFVAMNILADRPHAYIFFLLIRYLSLMTEKPPQTTTYPASPKLDPQWLELLHLRFNCALTDRAIARKMGLSDKPTA